MSTVDSDSDIEEVLSPPKHRPRVVRRPIPVRAKSTTSGQNSSQAAALSDSDDEDDEDFFRFRPAPAALQESEGDAQLAETNGTKKSAADTSSADDIVDLDNSDDDDDDDDEDDSGQSQESVAGEKRKHEENAGGEQMRRVRSRSVSLTPPPEAPRQSEPAPVFTRKNNAADNYYMLESDSEAAGPPYANRELDPALQAVIQSEALSASAGRSTESGSHAPSPRPHGAASPAPQLSRGTLERVQIEFQFMFDPAFLQYELPAMWDKRRWGRVKPTSHKTIEKKLDEHIAVVAFTSDIMAKALKAYSDIFLVDVLATDPVLMDRTMRVFPTSTLSSLGDRPAFYIKVYPRSVYNRLREQEAFEQEQLALEREQTRKELEMVRELQQNAAASDDLDQDIMHSETEDAGEAAGNTAEGIRLKIRDKAGKDTLLLVTPATTVKAVIENYRKLAQLDASMKIRLEFDDEALNPSDTIGNTEVEDDDMLTAFWG
ncbi:hypothetical protein IWW52_003912 [Coemansia sp. RSA 2704]|nr:hypothetical protein IWW52_003912 [Coemansia sp. RSA 2704]